MLKIKRDFFLDFLLSGSAGSASKVDDIHGEERSLNSCRITYVARIQRVKAEITIFSPKIVFEI